MRTQFVHRLESLDDAIVARSALHRRLKQQMRFVDMLFFTAERDDHHIARIAILAKQLR
jgi:hypothetical protein